jgi:hypothetical protein
MNPRDIHAEVRLCHRGRSNFVEVRVFERRHDDRLDSVPGGLIYCEVECIPEIMKALGWALEFAKEEGYLQDDADSRSASDKEGDYA